MNFSIFQGHFKSLFVIIAILGAVDCCEICGNIRVAFYLYKKSPMSPANQLSCSNLEKTEFQPHLPTKIIIHGWNADLKRKPLSLIREQYVSRIHNPVNVIAVDWSFLSKNGLRFEANETASFYQMRKSYFAAIKNLPKVASCLAKFIVKIRDIGARDIHLIGFSLGAHLAAITSNNLLPYKLPRITGLDPALPSFIVANLEKKLEASNAEFVDVYHTSAGVQGVLKPCGHVDFYFNLGFVQPGCGFFSFCSHVRAVHYFAESINSMPGFWGSPSQCVVFNFFRISEIVGPCVERALAGEGSDKSTRGVYFVKTRSQKPYSLG